MNAISNLRNTTTDFSILNQTIKKTSAKTVLDPKEAFLSSVESINLGKKTPENEKKVTPPFSCEELKSYYERANMNVDIDYDDSDTDDEDYTDDTDVKQKTNTKVYTIPDDGGSHNKVAVIDCFDKNKDGEGIDVDGNGTIDFSHGEVVARILEDELAGTGYTIEKMDTDLDSSLTKGCKALKNILNNIEDYRGVNISLSYCCDYYTVSLVMGEEITPDNLASKKDAIMEIVMGETATKFYNKYKDVLDEGYLPDLSSYVESGVLTESEAKRIEALLELRYIAENMEEFASLADEIAEQGVPVFIASGNDSSEFNFLALMTDNVEYIGSTSDTFVDPYDSNFYGDFSNNSLTTRKGQSSFYGHNIIDGKIDINGNGTGDLSSTGIDVSQFFITGTSFSSPWSLAKAILEGDAASETTSSTNTTKASTSYTNSELYDTYNRLKNNIKSSNTDQNDNKFACYNNYFWSNYNLKVAHA